MTEQQLLEIKEQLKQEVISELQRDFVLKRKPKPKKQRKQRKIPKNARVIKSMPDGLVFKTLRELVDYYKLSRSKIYEHLDNGKIYKFIKNVVKPWVKLYPLKSKKCIVYYK